MYLSVCACVQALANLRHPNIVPFLGASVMAPHCLVFEFMETDLHAAIRASILEDVHKQYIMYQAFKALAYMHSAKLVHRDMKPANLLLNAECLMKVADFGLARAFQTKKSYTQEVVTLWYRAPELLLGQVSAGVDWSC